MLADEGRNAEIAREMKESGAWLVPTYNGVDFLDKPAFYFKVVALSLTAFGDNETAARLPSVCFSLALIAMVFGFCRRVYGTTRIAWLAVMVVATMPLYFALSRTVIFDMALACFVCGAVFAGFLAEESAGVARRNWYLLASAAAGLATLVKGPVGVLIPLLVLLTFQSLAGRRGAWKRIFAPLNLLVFFGVTLPWFIGLCFAKRDFLHYGLVEETFRRFTDEHAFHRGRPFYYYLSIVAWTFFPWSMLLPQAMVTTWRLRRSKHRADLLMLAWSVLVIVFFSISQSKQPVYILSVTVASGILLARMLDDALSNPDGRSFGQLRLVTIAFVAMCCAVLAALLWGMLRPDMLAVLVKTSGEDLQRLTDQAWILVTLFGAFAGLGALGIFRRSPRQSFLALALFWPSFLVVSLPIINLVLAHRSDRTLAERLRSLPKETELATLKCFPEGLGFYRGQTLTLITKQGDELTSKYVKSVLAKPLPWPSNIVPLADFKRWLETRKNPVYLISRSVDENQVETIAEQRGATIRPLTPEYNGVLLPAGREARHSLSVKP